MGDTTVSVAALQIDFSSSTCRPVGSMHVALLLEGAPLSHIRDARRVLDETMSSNTTLNMRCVLNTAAICCADTRLTS